MVDIVILRPCPAETGGGQWRPGLTYSASDSYARALIGRGDAYDPAGALVDVGDSAGPRHLGSGVEADMLAVTGSGVLAGSTFWLTDAQAMMVLTALPASTRGNWVPFENARLHGSSLALLYASNVSTHNASGVVSTSAGQLFGFVVIDPGTDPTLIAYDNPSSASGRVLKTTQASEWAPGAFLYCGPDGVKATSGIYVALGGTVAPTVQAVFRGTPPVVTYTGTEMWFDGDAGSDSNAGTSINAPRKTISRFTGNFNSGDWRLYLKRGTTVALRPDVQHGCAGNILVTSYGDESLPKAVFEFGPSTSPETFTITNAGSGYTPNTYNSVAMQGGTGTGLICNIVVGAGGTVTSVARNTRGRGYTMGDVLTCASLPGGSGFTCTPATMGCGMFYSNTSTSSINFEFRDVDVRYNSTRNDDNVSGVTCVRGARLIAVNVDVSATDAGSKFLNGFVFGGNGSILSRCRVLPTPAGNASASTGFYGGNSGFPGANRAVLHACQAPQGAVVADAVTLHDAQSGGVGTSNAIVGGTFYAGTENCVDILGGYERTLVLGNIAMQGVNKYALAFSMTAGNVGGAVGSGKAIALANRVIGNDAYPYGLVLNRQPGAVHMGNYQQGMPTSAGSGHLVTMASTATGVKYENNTSWLKAGSGRAVFRADVGASGTYRNNLVLDDCTDNTQEHTTNFGALADWTVEGNYYRATSPRWYDGATSYTTFAGWNGTAANDVGHSTTDPVMVSEYLLPTGSTLIGAGVLHAPVCYLGLNGVFWQYGQPAVGAAQP